MKHIIAAIALLAATLPALAQAPLDRAREYRMWAAERMIDRLTVRAARTIAACSQAKLQAYFPKVSEACKEAVINAYPVLRTIREFAAGDDVVIWIKVVEAVHTLEDETEGPLTILERK